MKTLKIKIFEDSDLSELQEEIDQFLRIKEIKQEDLVNVRSSSSGTNSYTYPCVVISYFEEIT